MAILKKINDKSWGLKVPYEERSKIKSCEFATWYKKGKFWVISPSILSHDFIISRFPKVQIDQEIKNDVYEFHRKEKELELIKKGEVSVDYSFGDFKPYKHQELAFNFAAALKNSALFLDQGTGKTFILLHLINYRRLKGQINKALVVCPLSVINSTWIKDCSKFTDLKAVSLHDKNAKKRKELFNQEADIYLINFEAVSRYYDEIKKLNIDMLCIDESSKCKSSKSIISKSLAKLSKDIEYKVIASGSPAPNSPMELWPQFMILDGGATLGSNFFKFREKFFYQYGYGGYQWGCKKESREAINQRIYKKAIRFTKEQCLDLPEQIFLEREVELSKEQKKAYKDMAENMIAELDGNITNAAIAATQIIRFQQITSGFIRNEEGEDIDFKTNPKMDELKSLVEEINPKENKIVLWARFKRDIKRIIKEFKEYNIVDVFGETSDRDENIEKFIEDDSVRMLVAHPAAAGHGITLIQACYSIYYSLDYSLENYLQSIDRIHRIGQTQRTTYYNIIAKDTIDISVSSTLRRKEDLMEMLLKYNIKEFLEGDI